MARTLVEEPKLVEADIDRAGSNDPRLKTEDTGCSVRTLIEADVTEGLRLVEAGVG